MSEKSSDLPSTDKQAVPADRLTTPIKTTNIERRTKRHHSENLSTPSISGMLRGETQAGAPESDSNSKGLMSPAKEQPLDQNQLIQAWRDFAETVDAAQLKSALSVREPVLTDNYCVEYNLDNEVQRQRITMDLKPKLLAHLSSVLHNDHITIEFSVKENLQEIMNKPYTDQEKFNALSAKYPILGLMKQRFGLDFE